MIVRTPTATSGNTTHFEVKNKNERDKIRHRRLVQFNRDLETDTETSWVGLALSGGGVRSGAVSLGVIQALHKAGVLPYIDYLSTVSGGSYAGAYLSSSIIAAKQAETCHADPDQNGDNQSRTPYATALAQIEVGAGEGHPESVMRVMHHRPYIRKMIEFANGWLIGLLLVWLAVGSGVVALAAIFAYIIRFFCEPSVVAWLLAFDVDSDAKILLSPSIVLAGLWLLAWIAAFIRDPRKPAGVWAKRILYVTILMLLIGLAAILGTREMHVPGWSTEGETAVSQFAAGLLSALASALVIAMVPYLRPRKLLRSGDAPKSSTEKIVYWIATRALAYGVPFLVVAWLATEDISGRNDERDSTLIYQGEVVGWYKDFVWAPFWIKVSSQSDANSTDRVAQSIWRTKVTVDQGSINAYWRPKIRSIRELRGFGRKSNSLSMDEAFELLQDMADVYRDARVDMNFAKRVCSTGKYLVHRAANLGGVGDSRMQRMAMAMKDMRTLRGHIVNAVSQECLLNWKLYEDMPQTSVSYRLRRSAEGLHKTLIKPGCHNREELMTKMIAVNRAMLMEYSNGQVRSKDVVFSGVVLDDDQRTRARYAVGAALLCLLSCCCVNLNATSLHEVYRRRLADMWIAPKPNGVRCHPLHSMVVTDYGGALHILNASVIHLCCGEDRRRIEGFEFTQSYCGTDRQGVLSSEYMKGSLSIDDAVAISGGALTPIHSANPFLIGLMLMTNLRLGQWIENPEHHNRGVGAFRRFLHKTPFTPLRFLRSMMCSPDKRSYWFVSDGGLHENLGVESLLKRRCRVIVAVDASQDERYEFSDLARLQQRARVVYGIGLSELGRPRQPMDVSAIGDGLRGKSPQRHRRPPEVHANGPTDRAPASDHQIAVAERAGESVTPRRHFCVAQVNYPDADPGVLIYIKCSLNGDEPLDVQRATTQFPGFPHNATSDQFYEPEQFEAYRMLGFHMTEQVFRARERDAGWHGIDYDVLAEQVAESALVGLDQGTATSGDDPVRVELVSGEDEPRAVLGRVLEKDRSLKQDEAGMLQAWVVQDPVTSMPEMVQALQKVRESEWRRSEMAIENAVFAHPEGAYVGLIRMVCDESQRGDIRSEAVAILHHFVAHDLCLWRLALALPRLRKLCRPEQSSSDASAEGNGQHEVGSKEADASNELRSAVEALIEEIERTQDLPDGKSREEFGQGRRQGASQRGSLWEE